jgi:hypothetical protein
MERMRRGAGGCRIKMKNALGKQSKFIRNKFTNFVRFEHIKNSIKRSMNFWPESLK